MRDGEGGLSVLFDEQHRGPTSIDLSYSVEIFVDQLRRQAERRLIHDEEPGRANQGAGQRHHGLFAARERARTLVYAVAHTRKQAQHLLQAIGEGPLRLLRLEAETDVVPDTDLSEEPPAFGHEANAKRA